MDATEGPNDPLEAVAAWRAAGRRVAWAVVVRTWGSSPRPAGSRLAVCETGEFFGSVSGGCVEGAVVTEALAVLAGGPPKLLHFGVTHEMAWEVGLACGGQVEIYVEEVPRLFDGLMSARAAKRPVVLATGMAGGEPALLELDPAADSAEAGDRELLAAAEGALLRDACAVVETARGPVFLEPFNPPLRLVVVGAVHIAHPLSRLAAIAGFEVIVVDPRTAFTLPGVTRSTLWPDEAMAEIRPDRRTAIVTLTHDPKLDDPALAAALGSEAFFVGCLGSAKTHQARLARLADRGFTAAAISRLHGPVGLAIGARTPEEIAVSILAQLVESLRRPAQ
jgi:xanthine dehydrogenase accessory factor